MNEGQKIFKTKLDRNSIINTIIFHIIIGFIICAFFFNIPILNIDKFSHSGQWIMMTFFFLIPLFTFLYRPVSYVFSGSTLIIKKILWSEKISFENIASVEETNTKDLKLYLKLFGSGGVWGHLGIYYSGKYGNVLMQSTNKKNLFLIKLKSDKLIVVSPENPELFIEACKENKIAKV